MKTLNITLSKGQYEKAAEAKGDRTWREFLMDAAEEGGD